MFAIYKMFTWTQFTQAFQSASNGDALLHPFKSEGASEYGGWGFHPILDHQRKQLERKKQHKTNILHPLHLRQNDDFGF